MLWCIICSVVTLYCGALLSNCGALKQTQPGVVLVDVPLCCGVLLEKCGLRCARQAHCASHSFILRAHSSTTIRLHHPFTAFVIARAKARENLSRKENLRPPSGFTSSPIFVIASDLAISCRMSSLKKMRQPGSLWESASINTKSKNAPFESKMSCNTLQKC